ncbi:hypothetical protein HOY80DRAFT_976921 [Tuber brumale]|nr:hypothetical protein HOY80DRAFT_976921 [Tuber brumale]
MIIVIRSFGGVLFLREVFWGSTGCDFAWGVFVLYSSTGTSVRLWCRHSVLLLERFYLPHCIILVLEYCSGVVPWFWCF